MRHVPQPDGHRVERTHVERADGLLRTADTHGILGQRLVTLRRVLAYVFSLRLELQDVLLLECGAHQHGPPFADDWEYNAAVGDFLALHGPELGIDYRAFDPRYSPEALAREFADALSQPEAHRPPFFVRHPELVQPLEERVQAVSLASYDDVAAVVQREGRPVVLFSHQVLNDPDRRDDLPFWQLPGLHYHAGSIIEMDDMLSQHSAALAERGDILPDGHRYAPLEVTAFSRVLLRHIAGPQDAHLEAFRMVFGVTAQVRRAFASDGMIRYFWSSPA